LKKHAHKIENIEISTKDIQVVCGVRGKPIFDAIPLMHFITPILHMTIGKGNNVLDNYVAEIQAAEEGYSDEYYLAEKEQAVTTAAQLQAKEELAQFNMVTLEYEKDLKREQKRTALSVEERVIVELELSNIGDERSLLQDAVPKTKALQSQAKKWFAAESKKTENGKAFGQPINAKMDEVLKRNGIDRAAQFGGTIEGNGCWTNIVSTLLLLGIRSLNALLAHYIAVNTSYRSSLVLHTWAYKPLVVLDLVIWRK
jgi:hypothetical protein